MPARPLEELLRDSETEASLQSALDSLDETFGTNKPDDLGKKVADLRNELLQELATIRGQGSLF